MPYADRSQLGREPGARTSPSGGRSRLGLRSMDKLGSARSWNCASCERRLIVPDAPIDLALVFCDDPVCQQAMKREWEQRARPGEGVPRDYVTGETIDSVFELLKRSNLAAQLYCGRDLADSVKVAGRLRLAPVPGDDRECQGNAARCAVELAYLDAMCRRFGEPLSSVTRIAQPELFEARVRF